MKYLPCRTSSCRGAPALVSRASGILHCTSRLSTPVVTYLCRRCGRPSTINSQEFQSLPDMTDEEIAAKTCDITPPAPPEPHAS